MAIAPDQYEKDIAALVVKRDAGEFSKGELRLLPPLPPQPQQEATQEEEGQAAAPAEPAQP